MFAPSAELAVPTSVLMRVAAAGGVATPVTRLAAGHGSHRWPQFLPDGRRFIFFVRSEKPDTQGAYLGSLDGAEPTRVLASDIGVVFAPPNFLLYVYQETLLAVRFDAARGTVSGDPVPVAHGVGTDRGVFRGAFSVSSAGVLAHRAVSGSQRRQLVWINRTGIRLGTVGSPNDNGLASPELAPDEQRVAVVLSSGADPAVWLMEVGRGVPTRLTFDTGVHQNPVWSPDGQRLAFSSTRNNFHDLFEKPSSGVGDEQPLLVTGESKGPASWSRDAGFLLYASQDPATGVDLWALPLAGDRKPFPVVRTPFEEAAGQFSPDGRWVVYQSNKSGPMEIYVQAFPSGGPQQISTAGGSQPRWRRDGQELFYIAPDTRLMAVPIALGKDGQTIEPGTPVPLFPTRLASGANIVSVVEGAVCRRARRPVPAEYHRRRRDSVTDHGRAELGYGVAEVSIFMSPAVVWHGGAPRNRQSHVRVTSQWTERKMSAMPRRARTFTWNGKDVPPELLELPAGQYVVEAVEDAAPALTPDEESGIEAALESYRQGRVVDSQRAREIIDAALGR